MHKSTSTSQVDKECTPMTTYTRTLSTIAAAAVALTTALSAGAGQPPADRAPGLGKGQGRGGPGGPLPILRQLNLSETQREQIKALTDQRRDLGEAQSPVRKLADLQRALGAAIFADTPDSAQIDQLRAGIAEAEAAMLAARVDLQLKIAQILTPEQRQQARELAERRPTRAGRAGGPRGARLGRNPHATRP
jgi:periplasmic protein CpxP/Spy